MGSSRTSAAGKRKRSPVAVTTSTASSVRSRVRWRGRHQEEEGAESEESDLEILPHGSPSRKISTAGEIAKNRTAHLVAPPAQPQYSEEVKRRDPERLAQVIYPPLTPPGRCT